ncbi:MAG: hypothetical protein ACLVCH_16150 [Roseburia inulinivorans]
MAPLHLSSSGKGKDVATKQGNRRLQATIYFLAIQMVQVSQKVHREIRWYGHIMRNARQREKPVSRH